MDIGQIIRQAREEKGLSQEQVALHLGFAGRMQIWRIENNVIKLSAENLIKLAALLEIDLNDLVWPELARHRANNTPELEPFASVLTEYDWSEADHAKWVATAPTDEILDWCQSIT